MLNPLKQNNLSHVSHPFRLSLMCVCARMYARMSELSGTDVTHVTPRILGPSLGCRHAGAEPRVISLFKFFEKRWT